MAGFGNTATTSLPQSSGSGWTNSGSASSTRSLNVGGFGGGSAPAVSSPAQAAAKPASDAISALSKLISGSSGSGSSATSAPGNGAVTVNGQQPNQTQQAPSAPLVNTSTPNPTVDGTVIPALLNRVKGGMGAPEAIRLSNNAQRDALAAALKEQSGRAARTGGIGASKLEETSLQNQAQKNMAGTADNIAYKAEQDRNQLYQDTAGLALASDAAQNNQRSLALDQYKSQRGLDLEQQRINQARDNNLLSILTQALF